MPRSPGGSSWHSALSHLVQAVWPGAGAPTSSFVQQELRRKADAAAAIRLQQQMKQQAAVEPKEHLPNILWEPEQEFVGGRGRLANYGYSRWGVFNSRTRRVGKHVFSQVMEVRNVTLLMCSLSGVYGLGVYEAANLTAPTVIWDYDALYFVLSYSYQNILPGFIALTKPAGTVALSLGLDPSKLLAYPSCPAPEQLVGATGTEAVRVSQAQWASFLRKTLSSTTLIAQILRTVQISINAAETFRKGVTAGTEPPFGGVEERVVRFCPPYSKVTPVSLQRYGHHILPVMSNHDRGFENLIQRHSWGHTTPVYWHVSHLAYGYPRSWQRLGMAPEWLIRTTLGRNILCLEADATRGLCALALGAPTP